MTKKEVVEIAFLAAIKRAAAKNKPYLVYFDIELDFFNPLLRLTYEGKLFFELCNERKVDIGKAHQFRAIVGKDISAHTRVFIIHKSKEYKEELSKLDKSL